MRDALTILGFGPCHHMQEVTSNPVMRARWRAFMDSDLPDWDDLFEGYVAAVDWPSAHYWRELALLYPQAKVILTWRSTESWWTSFEATLLRYHRSAEDRASVGVRIIDKVFGTQPVVRAEAMALYDANVAAVRAEIPAERLLVHGLGDGWAPLCAHLGVAVPDQPYPSLNSTAAITSKFSIT